MKVVSAAIAVRDLPASLRFYVDVLGLREVRRSSPSEGMTLVFLQGDGGGMIELVEGVDKAPWGFESCEALFLVGLEVLDMDALVADLQRQGVSLTRGPIDRGGGNKIAFLKDPNGVEVELVQHGAPAGS
jgi:lactoylglutathione lyase